MRRRLTIRTRDYKLAEPFVISRGAKRVARQIEIAIDEDGATGRGAAVPYGRYGESIESAVAAAEAVRDDIESGADREALLTLLPPTAARASLDAALWDLAAQLSGKPTHVLAGLPAPAPVSTALTIPVAAPEAVAAAAAARAYAAMLKLKLAGDGADSARIAAALAAAPRTRLILDANEGLDRIALEALVSVLPAERIALIEQPLPASSDGPLSDYASLIPLYADESFHGPADIGRVKGLYRGVNVKLEKSGGLTAALAAVDAARRAGLSVMIGSMVGSSLALAPAFLLASTADVVDLDGALFLAEDDAGGVTLTGDQDRGAILRPPLLWGAPRFPGGATGRR